MTCVILASVSHTYSVATMDTTMMILLPFQMLLGEQLESGEWFVKKVKRTDIYDDVKIFLTDYIINQDIKKGIHKERGLGEFRNYYKWNHSKLDSK